GPAEAVLVPARADAPEEGRLRRLGTGAPRRRRAGPAAAQGRGPQLHLGLGGNVPARGEGGPDGAALPGPDLGALADAGPPPVRVDDQDPGRPVGEGALPQHHLALPGPQGAVEAGPLQVAPLLPP